MKAAGNENGGLGIIRETANLASKILEHLLVTDLGLFVETFKAVLDFAIPVVKQVANTREETP